MGKSNFIKNLTTGLKAIAGALAHYVLMILIVGLVAFIVGGYANIGAGLMVLLALVLLLTGIITLGYVYRKFWGWK